MVALNVGFGAGDPFLSKVLRDAERRSTRTGLQTVAPLPCDCFRPLGAVGFIFLVKCEVTGLNVRRGLGHIQFSSTVSCLRTDHLTLSRPHCRGRMSG